MTFGLLLSCIGGYSIKVGEACDGGASFCFEGFLGWFLGTHLMNWRRSRCTFVQRIHPRPSEGHPPPDAFLLFFLFAGENEGGGNSKR